MKTVAFYSYKGGVGRTLALSYTAKYLAECNFTVCILDLDLEAPGVIYKFEEDPKHQCLGVLDYVHTYINDKAPKSISAYFHTYEIPNSKGYIQLMNAGKDMDLSYWLKLATIDFNNLFFGDDDEGFELFQCLRDQIEEQLKPDFLFIDSRSGITALSKMCSLALADTTIILCANNTENRYGSKLMYDLISASDFNVKHGKTEVFCALTRIPLTDDNTQKNEMVQKLINAIGDPNLQLSSITVIHSDSRIENDEQVILRKNSEPENEHIFGSYYELITKIVPPHILEAKRKAVISNPNYSDFKVDISEDIADMLDSLRGKQSRQEFINETMKIEANSSEHLLKLAICQRFNNSKFEALVSLCHAISLGFTDDSLKAKAFRLRGMMFLYDFNNYVDALNDYMIAYEIDDSQSELLYYDIFLSYYFMDDSEKALFYLNKYMNSDECHINPSSLFYRGNLFDDLGNKEMAMTDYNKAIELEPDYAKAYNNRGNIYYYLENKEMAMADYNKVIELDPNAAKAYNNRAILFKGLGNKEMAMADYNKAIEFDPDNAKAYNNRAILFNELGNKEMAMADYNKAIELDPDLASSNQENSTSST